MTDGICIRPGGKSRIAADDVDGVQYPRIKLSLGADGAAADISDANPLPVAIISGGGGGSSGGLTNTELRASPVPVSGTFYPVTQPVSIATMPSTPVTGTFWPATQPISGTVAVSGSVAVTGSFYQATQPVSIASMPSTPVTGTFWQTTQPVSGTVTANAGTGTFAVSAASLPLPSGAATETTLAAISTKTPALGQAAMTASSPVVIASNQSAVPISGTVTANAGSGTFAVSGTFWQATQPVSGTFWQATQPVSIAATVAVSGPLTDTQLRASAVPVSGTVTITPPTLTKGTQGATGVSTQDLKDAGRAIVNAATAIAGVTAVTTEALLTLAVSRDGAATSNVTTIAVTSGKKLRIIGVIAGVISTAAAVISARVALRMNPSGAAAANSPILAILTMSQQAAALAQAGDSCVVMFPEAIEISGTMQVGLSQIASVTSGTIWASLIGYEY